MRCCAELVVRNAERNFTINHAVLINSVGNKCTTKRDEPLCMGELLYNNVITKLFFPLLTGDLNYGLLPLAGCADQNILLYIQ